MSRIGNAIITIPAGVTVDGKDGVITVKGPKGTLTQDYDAANITVKVEGAVATVTGVAGDTYSVAFTALVKVLPSCCAVHNTGNLKVQISAAGTVTNAHIVVVKLA